MLKIAVHFQACFHFSPMKRKTVVYALSGQWRILNALFSRHTLENIDQTNVFTILRKLPVYLVKDSFMCVTHRFDSKTICKRISSWSMNRPVQDDSDMPFLHHTQMSCYDLYQYSREAQNAFETKTLLT